MPRSRHLLTALVLIGLLAMVIPAFSSAACSGAGDSQYCDPLNGGGHTSNSGTGTSSSPSTTPASSPAPAATSAAGTTSSTPAATTPAQTTTAGSRTLPFTGYASWEAAGLGLVLVGGGLTLRLRARDRRA